MVVSIRGAVVIRTKYFMQNTGGYMFVGPIVGSDYYALRRITM